MQPIAWASARSLPAVGAGALLFAVAGCATRADLLQQERKLSGMIEQQSRSVEQIRRELERLREDLGRGSRPPTGTPGAKVPPRAKANVAKPAEPPLPPGGTLGMTMSPEGVSTEDPSATADTVAAPTTPPAQRPVEAPPASGEPPAPGASPPAPATAPTSAPTAAIDEDWKRQVAQDRAVASVTGAAERAEYLGALEGIEKGDCSKAIARLKTVSSGSPLSDDAIYWQGKCLAARGDRRKAESRLNEVVTRYPKSDKAPAALWERGQIQLRAGNSSAARVTLSRLVRDYPASAEAAKARKKLAELPR